MFIPVFDLEHKRKHFSFVVDEKILRLDPTMYSTCTSTPCLNNNIFLDKHDISFTLLLYDAWQFEPPNTTIIDVFVLL